MRNIDHHCKCGCGKIAKKCYNSSGQFKQYAAYAEGCIKDYRSEKRTLSGIRRKGMGNPAAVPIGSKRIDSQKVKWSRYWLVKVNETGPWVREHRYVMEQNIGRKLNPGEVVHHINGNTLDNRIENLVLMSNAFHSSMTQRNVSKKPVGQWSIKFSKCTQCGLTTSPYCSNGICARCYRRNKSHELRP